MTKSKMGADQSSLSVDGLKDRLLSIAVVTAASSKGNNVRFIEPTTWTGDASQLNTLPLVSTSNVASMSFSDQVALYSNYYNDSTREHIDAYLQGVVLKDQASADAFLADILKKLTARPVASHLPPVEPTDEVSTHTHQTLVDVKSQAQPKSHKPRGASKLDRRMNEMRDAIDQEQAVNRLLQENTAVSVRTATIEGDIQSTVGPMSMHV